VQTSDNTASPLGTQIGLGVALSNTQIRFTQGSAMQTGLGLDAMIQGDGFFQVELPDGRTAYTRAGNFVRNADGELVLGNSIGYRLKDTPTIPDDVSTDQVSIGSNGQVVALTPDGTQQVLGQITLARFANPGGLIQYGANVFLQSEASGDPTEAEPGLSGTGTLLPGTLELSNTEAVTELVELIKTQRVFQMNSQSIETADETLQTVANLRR
jgi:flagellar basal-body rod protein FlgG